VCREHAPVVCDDRGVHHLHGAPIDYVTLGAAAFASWVGLPGPGEPALIAAGVLAGDHRLALPVVLAVAVASAAAGGVVGWWIGIRAGRRLVTAPGPLRGARRRALERGEEVFARWPGPAVVLTLSWMAGVHHVRLPVFVVWNAVGAVLWSLGIGLGAYLAGPPVVHFVDKLGWVTAAGVAGLVAAGVVLEVRRHRARSASP
jgi:membrane protein DedA with SNARE-associated domain